MRQCRLSLPLIGVGSNLHLDDLVGVGDAAAAPAALLDLVDELHTRGHLAPDRVLAVEKWRRRKTDKELAVGAVWVVGAGHRSGAADVMLLRELRRQRLTGAAAAGARRISGLGHKAVDHP